MALTKNHSYSEASPRLTTKVQSGACPTSPPPYPATNADYLSSDNLSCSGGLGFLCALGRIGL
jgi:hypothetical protein